jgi:hypothetical protein
LQQQMEREIAGLRGRLRAALASRTPQAARLAMLDTVMEQVLGAREQAVLAQCRECWNPISHGCATPRARG